MDRLGGNFDSFDGEGEYDDHIEDIGPDHGAHSNPPPSPVGQDERRMQVRAYNHWSELLGGQNLPHIEDLEPEFLGDFGPYSVLLDFSTGSTTPTVQFIGSELRGECRMHDLVEELGDIPRDSLLARIADNYLQVTTAQAPVPFEDECTNARGQKVAYRGILLPYSSDHDTIDFVYAVVNWKEVADSRTADELLAEIDRAMEQVAPVATEDAEEAPASVAEIVRFHGAVSVGEDPAEDEAGEAQASDPRAQDENILEMRGNNIAESGDFGELPAPRFGHHDGEEDEYEPLYGEEGYVGAEDDAEDGDYAPLYGEEGYVSDEDDAGCAEVETEAVQDYDPAPRKRDRMVDALGNPIGGAAQDDEGEEPAAGGITTAADYGLPEWDEEEDEGEDVDELVNPLADIDLNSRLLSLVNAGTRGKKTVDLATLSDSPSDEDEDEEEAQVDRQLFRPKAPSVDTLLSPEPYDAEAEAQEDHAEYDYDQPARPQPVEDYAADYAAPVEEDAVVDEEATAAEVYEVQDAVEPEAVAQADTADETVADVGEAYGYEAGEGISEAAEAEEVAASFEAPAGEIVQYAYEAVEVEAHFEQQPVEAVEAAGEFAEVEPLELGEEMILEETVVEDVVEKVAAGEFAPVEAIKVEATDAEQDDAILDAQVYEAEPVEIEAEADETVEAAVEVYEPVVEDAAEEAAHDISAPEQPAQEGSLVGLQAAVRDLAEAARSTEDVSRRALYEAVGRAFDVSIKAVIAAETHAEQRANVVEHLPLDRLPAQGPETALVMVRRTANGGTEIVGEVPHDSILLETAALKLAGN